MELPTQADIVGGLWPIKAMREVLGGKPLTAPDPGIRPDFRWVAPTALFVDAKYQRSLSQRSHRLIAKIIKEFSWRKFKPCIVVAVPGAGLHCIDGQHGAIAAATLNISEIPVFVVSAASLLERADSFVAHNKDRVLMTPLDIFRAKAAALDPTALDVVNVCKRAGVTLKNSSSVGRVDIGDCAAVQSISGLVKRHGPLKARMVLESLVKGGRAPISSAEIIATEAVMVLLRPATTVEEMAQAIKVVSDHGVLTSRMEAVQQGKPHKHVLFGKYMQILERQTGVIRVLADG